MKVNPDDIKITNRNKVLFPEHNITKGDLVDYYKRIGHIMVPLVSGRPVTMHRFPDGINKDGFYQQEMPEYFPDWFDRVNLRKREGGSVTRIVCTRTADLVYLANQACITPHIWLSRKENLNSPDRMIFDLDPPAKDFKLVCSGALALRENLESRNLAPLVITTGSRGLHIVVPLKGDLGFDAVRKIARDTADKVATRNPENFTTEQRKEKRGERLYLDTSRNAYGQTAVAPYAVRPLEGAPVAAPLDWDEIKEGKIVSAQQYNLKNIFRRLAHKKDPWEKKLTP